jgi:hypothetical protein
MPFLLYPISFIQKRICAWELMAFSLEDGMEMEGHRAYRSSLKGNLRDNDKGHFLNGKLEMTSQSTVAAHNHPGPPF